MIFQRNLMLKFLKKFKMLKGCKQSKDYRRAPLMLAMSVFFAIKEATPSTANYKKVPLLLFLRRLKKYY